MLQEIKLNHSVSVIAYHIVLVTKYRHNILTDEIKEKIRNITSELSFSCLEINGEEDHLHILLQAPPTIAPAKIVQKIKSVSSLEIKKIMPTWLSWKRGYYLSTVSDNSVENVKKHIQNQKELPLSSSFRMRRKNICKTI